MSTLISLFQKNPHESLIKFTYSSSQQETILSLQLVYPFYEIVIK